MTINLQDPLWRIVPGSILDRRRNWYVFRAFNLYRLTLAAIVLGLYYLDDRSRFFGQTNPSLFLWATVVYVGFVVLSILGSLYRRPSLKIQSHFQAAVDLIGLSLLIHASGGIASNLSILLVMAIAASGILLPLYSVLLFASLAFFIMLGEWIAKIWEVFKAIAGTGSLTFERISEFFGHLQLYGDELVRLGILGASFFIAAVITSTLAERARRSEELARQRTSELLEMAELNQAIVQHLQSGIIVVDRFAHIRLMNDTAHEQLNYPDPAQGTPLERISPPLNQRLSAWLNGGVNNPQPFRQAEHLPDITPSFSHFSGNRAVDTLIFLEDSAQVAQRLQQIKLAALGRLTAGIAHEIRNPLASISHAAQLLEESPNVSPGDRRLGQIIHDNAKRANQIIANVLDLSRRDRTRPEDFTLQPWLEEFCREFLRAYKERTPNIAIQVQPVDLAVRFDPSHLYQILWNLCTNAYLHGALPTEQTPRIRLTAGRDKARLRPFLDVIDFGPGIPEAEAGKIFEPFFTTKPRGTGLGLYISREMCEANRAQLQYLRSPQGGSCFRITFANSSKQESQWTPGMP